ncbi:MAG: hypothetical protein ACOYNL_07060 [Rickettsiales bacterium]
MSSIGELCQQFHFEFALTPIMGAEIECYVMLADETPAAIDKFWEPVEKAFHHDGLSILRIEKERGVNQYEIVTNVMLPQDLAYTLAKVRQTIEKYAARMHVEVSFAAKPFADQPSSGIHLHLHLADAQGVNVFHKTDDWASSALLYSLGGLLKKLPSDMPIFFPNFEDYARLRDEDHVPKIFGWGVNNRYCALRIPATSDQYDKRIEHRVPCANADASATIAAMLGGVLLGLREKIIPPEQQYGKWGNGATFQQLAAAPVSERTYIGAEG